jgi:hypothetical protein
VNPHPEPTAPDAASESAIEHVFRAWHEAVLAQDADKIADLYAAGDVIETPTAVLLSGDMGSGVVQGRESIRAFLAGSFAARRREGVFENWVAYRDLPHRRASVDLGVPAPDTDGRTDPPRRVHGHHRRTHRASSRLLGLGRL